MVSWRRRWTKVWPSKKWQLILALQFSQPAIRGSLWQNLDTMGSSMRKKKDKKKDFQVLSIKSEFLPPDLWPGNFRNPNSRSERQKPNPTILQIPVSKQNVCSNYITLRSSPSLHLVLATSSICNTISSNCPTLKLTTNSNRRKSAVLDNKCTFIRHPVFTLSIAGIIFAFRHPTSRCIVLSHYSACISTSERPNTFTNRHSSPKAASVDSRWNRFRAYSTP